jgi:protein SCO1/2
MKPRSLNALCASVVLIVTCFAYRLPAESPSGTGDFPNLPVFTHTHAAQRFYDDVLKGKTVVIEFMCTRCADATLRTTRLGPLQNKLGTSVGRDVFFYSITVDPAHDSPEVLHDYAEANHAGPGWVFLTGRAADIELIVKTLNTLGDSEAEQNHYASSLLIGSVATGNWRRTLAFDYPLAILTAIDQSLDEFEAQTLLNRHNAAALSDTARGAHIFRTECAGCHTVGRGDRVGPDLQFVTKVVGQPWMKRFISNPSKLIETKDPIASALYEKYGRLNMPTIGLAEKDVDAVIDYLSGPAVKQ